MRTLERSEITTGDYYADERELFRVEQAFDGRVLLEDCLTEALIEVPIGELARLRRVEREPRARDAAGTPVTAGSER
ncbi:MAG: hypothetical protein ACRDLO_09475 [Solirubrobacterales bacterium]